MTDAAATLRFPRAFAWGTSTAAYQIEGGWNAGGRGLSIWDAFSHTPGRIKTGETGDVATDHYHRFRADVKLMAQMGLKYYRFSLSWSRIVPAGTGKVNEEGVRFYSTLIDELLRHGIHPVVTLYHWDLPLPLQLERDGWLSTHTASAFVAYAAVCFERFGGRVRHWLTINEPAVQGVYGYARGEHAPGRAVAPRREPYLAVHNMLLAHAYAVARYRRQFARSQQGLISIALNSDWREPLTSEAADLTAAQRSMEFNLGWLADPLYFGEYPASMRARLGDRLPTFTPEQRQLVVNSTDFFALQHYSTMMVSDRPAADPNSADSFYADEAVNFHPTTAAKKNMLGWDIAPFGMYKLAKWVHQRYAPSGGIVITENGMPLPEHTAEAGRRDGARTCYLKLYLQQLARAMAEGVDVRGYFVWSFIDNFEWREGTAARFGLVFVDYKTLARTPKGSAGFYARLAQSGSFSLKPSECNASVPAVSRFQQEATQLQQLINASASSASPKLLQQMAIRTLRLALIADMQTRYEAEQGDFELMHTWADKARKLREGAQRQRVQLQRWVQQQQQVMVEAAVDASNTDADADADADAAAAAVGQTPADELTMSLPDFSLDGSDAEVDVVHDAGRTLEELQAEDEANAGQDIDLQAAEADAQETKATWWHTDL